MRSQDWIRGKIPYYVAPPEPTDAAGKPIPRPLKLGSSSVAASASSSSKKKDTPSVFDKIDENGNTTRRVPGVQQPLHQIVHSTKFLPDDVRRIDADEEEEEEESGEEEDSFEDDGEEWGGIQSDSDDAEGLEEEEDDSSEGDDAPLEWDDLFAQAVGEADHSAEDVSVAVTADAADDLSDDDSDPEFTVEVEEEHDVDLDSDDEEDFGTGDEDDVEVVVDGAPSKSAATKAAARKAPAGAKRSKSRRRCLPMLQALIQLLRTARAIDVVSSDDESDSGRPVKEKRMTTNKKKATNFFTTANVKKYVLQR